MSSGSSSAMKTKRARMRARLRAGDDVGRELQEHDPDHDDDAEGRAGAAAGTAVRRAAEDARAARGSALAVPTGGSRRADARRCCHGDFQRTTRPARSAHLPVRSRAASSAGKDGSSLGVQRPSARHGILGGEMRDADHRVPRLSCRRVASPGALARRRPGAGHGRGRRRGRRRPRRRRQRAQRVLTLAEVERTALEAAALSCASRARRPTVAQAQAEQARSPLLPAGHRHRRRTRARRGNFAPRPGVRASGRQPLGGSLFSTSYDYCPVRGDRARSSSTTSGRRREKYERREADDATPSATASRRRADRSCSTCGGRTSRRGRTRSWSTSRTETLDDQNKHLAQVQGMVTVGTQPPIALAQQKAAVRQRRRAAHHVAEQLRDRRRRS